MCLHKCAAHTHTHSISDELTQKTRFIKGREKGRDAERVCGGGVGMSATDTGCCGQEHSHKKAQRPPRSQPQSASLSSKSPVYFRPVTQKP